MHEHQARSYGSSPQSYRPYLVGVIRENSLWFFFQSPVFSILSISENRFNNQELVTDICKKLWQLLETPFLKWTQWRTPVQILLGPSEHGTYSIVLHHVSHLGYNNIFDVDVYSHSRPKKGKHSQCAISWFRVALQSCRWSVFRFFNYCFLIKGREWWNGTVLTVVSSYSSIPQHPSYVPTKGISIGP